MSNTRYTRRINLYINGKEVKNDINSISKVMRKLQNEQKHMTRNSLQYQAHAKKIRYLSGILQKHRNDLRQTESIWKRAGTAVNNYMGMAMGVIAAFAGILTIMKKFKTTIDEFEEGITNVYTLLDDDDYEAFKDLLDQGAVDLIKEYGFEIKDVNKALFDAISAGVPAGEAIQFIKDSSILAKGGVTSLTATVDGLTTVLNAYNLESSETAKVSAAFFTAQKYGKTTVEELATGIGKVVPIAALAGVSYSELLSGVAAMTTQGIKSDLAMTAMKNTIQSTLNPSKEAAKVLRELGVPVGITEVRAKGLGFAMNQLNVAIRENPDAISAAIPNIRGLVGVSALAGNGLETYHKILEKVNNDYGDHSSLSKAYAKQMETNVQKMKSALGARKSEILALKNDLSPIFIQAIKLSTLSTRMFLKFLQVLTRNKEVIFALAAAIAAYYTRAFLLFTLEKSRMALMAAEVALTKIRIVLTGKVSMAQKRLLVTTRALNIATKASPWGLALAAIAGLIVAYNLFKNKVKETIKEQRLFNGILLRSEELMGNTKTLEQRAQIMKHLSQEQLATLESDLAYQIREEDNFHAKLLSKLKERLAEDAKLTEMNQQLKSDTLTEAARVNIQIAIGNRKLQLARELEDESKGNKARIKVLQKYLADVSALVKTEKENGDELTAEEKANALKAAYDTAIKALDTHLTEKKILYTNQRASELISEQAFNDKMNAVQLAHLANKSFIQQQFGQDNNATLLAIANKELSIFEEKNKQKLEMDKAMRKLMAEANPEEQDENTPALDYAVQQYQETLDYKLVMLEAMRDKNLIGEQEYQDNLTALLQDAEQKRMAIKMDNTDQVLAIAYGAADAVSMLMDMELAEAEGNEKEQKKIRKKYADVHFAVTVGQIIASTSLAIMQALAQMGPIAGGIMAGIIGGIGAIQIATATKERSKVKNMYDGGFAGHTGKGGKYEKAQLVQLHKGEYVIPQELMAMPAVASIVDGFEAMRTNPANVNKMANIPQMYTGGMQSKNPSADASISPFTQTGIDKETAQKLITALDGFSKKKLIIYTETIKKDLEELEEIQTQSGL